MLLKQVPTAAEIWRYESVGEMSDNTENCQAIIFLLHAASLPDQPALDPALADRTVIAAFNAPGVEFPNGKR